MIKMQVYCFHLLLIPTDFFLLQSCWCKKTHFLLWLNKGVTEHGFGDRCALTSMRIKDAPHCLPALSAAVEGWLPADGGWHGIVCSIRHRWSLSRRVGRSFRVDSVESEDHGGILSCGGILPGCSVVLWGRVSCFGLQESGWGSAANTVTLTMKKTTGEDTMYLCRTKNHQHYSSVQWISAHTELLVGNANAIQLLLSACGARGLSPEHRRDVVAGQNAHFARSER